MRSIYSFMLKASVLGVAIGSSFTNLQAVNLMDAIKNAKIEGFAFGRIQTIHGKDGDGTRWQFRLKPTITTGEVAGFSVSGGIFFSKGSGTPDGNNTNNEISGSRGDVIASFVDRFNIGDFYVTYNAKEPLGSNTIIRGGQKSPDTPFNDKNLDRALGIFIENKDLSFLNVGLQWWDSWMGDDMYLSFTGMANNAMNGIGNDMFMISFASGKDFTDKTGVGYNLWYGYSEDFINYMIFGDISYTAKFANQSLSILAQISALGLQDTPRLTAGGAGTNGSIYQLFRDGNYNYAKHRGVYNIRLDYRYNITASEQSEEGESTTKNIGHIGFALGFVGTFGNGYGTMIDNTGALKVGGSLWYSFSGNEANGFGILGAGGFDKSSLYSPYVKFEIGYKKFTFALDVAYVNTTHFYYLTKGASGRGGDLNNSSYIHGSANTTNGTTTYSQVNRFYAAHLVDVSPSIVYKFTDSINMAAYYGYLIGDPSLGRFRFQVNYVF